MSSHKCQCDKVAKAKPDITGTTTASPVNPPPSMFCITNNQCETDEQCPGGKCEHHKTSGV